LSHLRPQSNQRGIETSKKSITVFKRRKASIEPAWDWNWLAKEHWSPGPKRLNRTSVGLKLAHQERISRSLDVPQSNQRGIETGGVCLFSSTQDKGLNRTSVGLKRAKTSSVREKRSRASIEPAWDWNGERDENIALYGTGLNRTSVGLKRTKTITDRCGTLCLNRTSVGLKQYDRTLFWRFRCWPQSNQRGIETRASYTAPKRGRGLNRTSVGLKPGDENRTLWSGGEPQSNQRGIETEWHSKPTSTGLPASIEPAWDWNPTPGEPTKAARLLPQSNQRGIETTSASRIRSEPGSPQSNQRGIETSDDDGASISTNTPQSNQRGIETKQQGMPRQTPHLASIEPAWDWNRSPRRIQKPPSRSLNRTSVGLKRFVTLSCGPDSHLASIEPAWDWNLVGFRMFRTFLTSLNRTSVGLKRGSNQWTEIIRLTSLNRTSVGLKLI